MIAQLRDLQQGEEAMLSIYTKPIGIRFLLGTASVALAVVATPAQADIQIGLAGGPNGSSICLAANSTSLVTGNPDTCNSIHTQPTRLFIGNPTNHTNFNATDGAATFNTQATFNAGVSMTGSLDISAVTTFTDTVSFQGSSTTFATPTTFTLPSTFQGVTTFNGLADFNNGITANSVSSTTISATSLTSGLVQSTRLEVQDDLFVSTGANITMGLNQVHGVADGAVFAGSTDAVNGGQLFAATAGIAADVTALKHTTATHTTQIAAIETVNATQSSQISAIQAVNATQSNQITALQAADLAFDSRIDTLEALAIGFEQDLDRIDNRASAGTAAAVALSGAMFLPGKSFNLTANVGSYRGAHAGAIQFGALVSDNVAVNAGVAHGFNKGGKTAVRAGFTLGW